MSAKVANYELPDFDQRDLDSWSGEFSRWLRLTGHVHSDCMSKIDWVMASCNDKRTQKLLSHAADQENVHSFGDLLNLLKDLFLSMETDADLRL